MPKMLKISLIQKDLVWEDPRANLNNVEEIIEKLPSSDIIVLPELFTTGFSMNVHGNAEEMDGLSYLWMKKIRKCLMDFRSHLILLP